MKHFQCRFFILLITFFGVVFYPALNAKAEKDVINISNIHYINTRTNPEKIYVEELSEEEIAEEIKLGEMELIAQLVMAEAGNQDLTGKRYIVDVVLNRVDSDKFPNTVEEVIFQKNQFSVIKNGAFDKAAWEMTEECYEAVQLEYKERSNYDVLYFGRSQSKYAANHFKYQSHWFGW